MKPGQNVLILAAIDGLHGGRNLVDEHTVTWIQSGVQARGAHPTVIWADMPSRPDMIWPDIPTPETAWKIPPIVKAAMKGADLLINHISDLSSEEHLKEFPELLKELKLPFAELIGVDSRDRIAARQRIKASIAGAADGPGVNE